MLLLLSYVNKNILTVYHVIMRYNNKHTKQGSIQCPDITIAILMKPQQSINQFVANVEKRSKRAIIFTSGLQRREVRRRDVDVGKVNICSFWVADRTKITTTRYTSRKRGVCSALANNGA